MTISTQELSALERIRKLPEGEPILSVYVALDPSRNVTYTHLPELTALIRSIRDGLDEQQIPGFEREAERCLDYVRNLQPGGRTLLIFSSIPRELWLTIEVQAELPSHAFYGSQPYLLPLLIEPTLERRVIVTIDSANARIVTSRFGEIESEQDIGDYVPRGTRKMGRKFQSTGGDHERGQGSASFGEDESLAEWVAEHYRNVIGALEELEKSKPFERLAIGGTNENTARLVESLPEHIRSKLAGSFHVEPEASRHLLPEQAAGVFREKRAAEARDDIATATGLASGGGAASLGWEDTLAALQQGSVMRLLLAQDAQTSGSVCDDGHYIGVQATSCPVCSKKLRTVEDMPALAARLADETGAEISYVAPPVSEDLSKYGGIAAILRY